MVVVDQTKVHVRAFCCPALNHPRIHGCVVSSLKDQRRLPQLHLERIVAGGVFVECKADVAVGVARVVEDTKMTGPPPLLDSVLAELPEPIPAEVQCRRQQDEPIDFA